MGGLTHAMQACSIGSKGSCSTTLLHVYLAVMNEDTVGASYCWHHFFLVSDCFLQSLRIDSGVYVGDRMITLFFSIGSVDFTPHSCQR